MCVCVCVCVRERERETERERERDGSNRNNDGELHETDKARLKERGEITAEGILFGGLSDLKNRGQQKTEKLMQRDSKGTAGKGWYVAPNNKNIAIQTPT